MKTLIVDFSRVLIFPMAKNVDSLNRLHKELSSDPNYKILDHFTLNHELLDYLERLKDKVPVYVFTDGKLHELPEVWIHLKDIFKETYSVDSLALDKKQSDAYRVLAGRVGVRPAEITFVDDKPANVEAARQAGIHAIHYTSNDVLIKELDRLLVQ